MKDITNDLEESTGEDDPGWGRIVDTPESDDLDIAECAERMGLKVVKAVIL